MEYLHVMVRITNIEESLDFYCNKLGMVETNRIDNEKGKFTLIFLSAPNDLEKTKTNKAPLLELTYNWDSEETYYAGRNFGHIAFRVSNIYEICDSLMKKGVIINRPPKDGHMAFIKSPDGISIELLQKGDSLPINDKWANMDNVGTW